MSLHIYTLHQLSWSEYTKYTVNDTDPSASHVESHGLLQLASRSKALPCDSSIGADFSLWFILNHQHNFSTIRD
jgi:hypothetical protein